MQYAGLGRGDHGHVDLPGRDRVVAADPRAVGRDPRAGRRGADAASAGCSCRSRWRCRRSASTAWSPRSSGSAGSSASSSGSRAGRCSCSACSRRRSPSRQFGFFLAVTAVRYRTSWSLGAALEYPGWLLCGFVVPVAAAARTGCTRSRGRSRPPGRWRRCARPPPGESPWRDLLLCLLIGCGVRRTRHLSSARGSSTPPAATRPWRSREAAPVTTCGSSSSAG